MEFIHRPEPDPNQPAVVMAGSGETLTHGGLRARVNRLAHLLRAAGLRRGDHFAIFMENHPRYIECGRAGGRSGLYYTNVNCYLTPDELAYILNNSQSQVLITSQWHRAVALEALRDCPKVRLCLVVDAPGQGDAVRSLDEAAAGLPETPIPDESSGWAMFYSSGTTGHPKGILRPLPETSPDVLAPVGAAIAKFWDIRERERSASSPPHSITWRRGRRLGSRFSSAGQSSLRRDSRRHGALRSGGGAEGDRDASRHLRPVRPDYVLPHVEAAA